MAWGLIAPPEEQEFGNLCAHLWTDAKYRARRRCVASCGVVSTRRFARAPVLLTSMCRYDPDWSLEYPHQTANGAESASPSGWSELKMSRFEPTAQAGGGATDRDLDLDLDYSVALRLVESNTLRRVGRGSNPVRRPVSRSGFKFESWPRPKLGTETAAGPGAANSRLYMELSLKA